MKVLYIAHYREGTGWAKAAIDYILSMDKAGIDVVPRCVKLNNNNPELPKRLLELEEKDSSGCDYCIQHVLPHYMDYSDKFKKNIAIYATETSHFSNTIWPRKINLMDEAWVINQDMVTASKNSGVNIPIRVVPHATEFEKFEKSYKPIQLPCPEDDFVFYFVGELNPRKNIQALIRAFHLEFHKNEPTSLVLKVNGGNPESVANSVREMCHSIKSSMKIHQNPNQYKEDYIISDYLQEEDLYRLHNTCDCFVMPSHGEAWSIPAFDAMGFGKTPICSSYGGMRDFVEDSGILVEGIMQPVDGMNNSFNDLYVGNEDWFCIDINKLRKSMRIIYEMRNSSPSVYQKMKEKGKANAHKYSYEIIGNMMKSFLND